LDVAGTQREIGWEDLGAGHVQVEFNRADAEDDADAEDEGED